MDFAPVADVNTNPENIIICDRAFSDDPADLLAFWNREIKKMRKLKMKVEITRESEKDGFEGRHEVRG